MLRCKKEEPAGEEPVAAALDFLSKFSGKRFDALVAEVEPHAAPAAAKLQQAFAQRLEDIWYEEQCAGEEVEEEEKEEVKEEEEKEQEQLPPWRRAPAAIPALKVTPVPSPAGTGSMSASSSSCLPASAPSAFSYGPGIGPWAEDKKGKTLRFFDNGHLTFLMIDLRSRMRQCFKLVFPSFKFELLSFWFLSQENVYVCHIQGDPFKKPDGYDGSQRQWERAHGHERQRGGENLDTLIYVFTVRDHLALFRKQWNHDSKTRTDHQISFAQHSVAI
jgi:hypothetical protein